MCTDTVIVLIHISLEHLFMRLLAIGDLWWGICSNLWPIFKKLDAHLLLSCKVSVYILDTSLDQTHTLIFFPPQFVASPFIFLTVEEQKLSNFEEVFAFSFHYFFDSFYCRCKADSSGSTVADVWTESCWGQIAPEFSPGIPLCVVFVAKSKGIGKRTR